LFGRVVPRKFIRTFAVCVVEIVPTFRMSLINSENAKVVLKHRTMKTYGVVG